MSTARDGSSRPVTRAHSSGPNARSPIVAVIFDGMSFVADGDALQHLAVGVEHRDRHLLAQVADVLPSTSRR